MYGAVKESAHECKHHVKAIEVFPFQYSFHNRRGEEAVQRAQYLLRSEIFLVSIHHEIVFVSTQKTVTSIS